MRKRKAKKAEGLTARDLLEQIFVGIRKGREISLVEFEPTVQTQVADDRDYPGDMERVGYLSYNRAAVVQLENDWIWTLGVGQPRNYPAEQWQGDLIAFDCGSKAPDSDQIKSMIRGASYFSNSLILFDRDGFPNAVARGEASPSLSVQIAEILKDSLRKAVVRFPKREEEVANSDLTPVYNGEVIYRFDAVDLFVATILKVLPRVSAMNQ